MRIVVTGAAGFVGSHLCEQLAARGCSVVGVDCFADYYAVRSKQQNVRELSAVGVRVKRLDLASDSLHEVLADAAAIYHLAAQPGLSPHIAAEQYYRNNVVATRALVKACCALQRPPFLVNVSTSSVYGLHATVDETAVPTPASVYGETKLAAERLALTCGRERGFPVCSARLFSVYGPRERPEKLCMKLIQCLSRGEEFPLYAGSLDHRRAFTFVGDAVDGLLAILDHRERCAGEIFNIGSEIETTTRQAIAIVARLLRSKARLKILPPRPGDQLHTRANIAKARAVLGYTPQTGLEHGLQAQISWYRQARR